MALNKSLEAKNDVISIFEPEVVKRKAMGIKKEKLAHILNRLIDAYTKPIEATVREVVSNATDATVLVPVDQRKPIQITSPSTFKPSLTVADEGTGMSLEIVDEVFSEFGGSTKEDDFSQIGAYGLGAKAPLSYCPEFSVSTTRDGITTDVLLSRKSEGVGATILSSRETDLPNGTVVTIPVRLEDRAEFVKALESYRKYSFDAEIVIDGQTSSNTENYINFDQIVLDEETQTLGRVWAHKDALFRIFKQAFESSNHGNYYRRDAISKRYSLSGWIYSDPEIVNDRYYEKGDYDVIIELKPGIVDFSTSRDEITKNDRSRALSEKSTSAITKNPQYIFNNIMKRYPTLTDREAYLFASELVDLINPAKTTETTIWLGKDKIEMSFEIKEFQTASGFNPFDLILKRHEKNVVAIVSYGHQYYTVQQDIRPKITDEVLAKRPDYKLFYSSESWSSNGDRRVGTINAHIIELFQDGARKESLVDYVAEMIRNNRSFNKVNIVTSADEAKMRKINARRKMSEKIFKNAIVFYTNLKEISAKELAKLTNILPADAEVESITAEELIEKANEVRKDLAKLNPPVGKATEPVHLYQVDTSEAKTKKDVLSALSKRATSVSITLEDLMAADAILVLGDHRNRRSVLIGAANAGVEIVGRDIYYLEYNSGFRAAHYDKLKEYESVFVSKEWNYNSASFQLIRQNRSYNESTLNEEIDAMSNEKITSMYVLSKSRHCGNTFLKFLETSTTDHAENDIFSLVAKASRLEEYPVFTPDYMLKVLNKKLGEEKARKIRAFVEASQTFRSGSFTDTAVNTLLRFNGTILPGESLAVSARDAFIQRYLDTHEQILVDEQAALDSAAEIINSVDLTEASV
jgi:hypothetical protein